MDRHASVCIIVTMRGWSSINDDPGCSSMDAQPLAAARYCNSAVRETITFACCLLYTSPSPRD
eukprot:12014535-Alexandrium_andersonii.AAC.1